MRPFKEALNRDNGQPQQHQMHVVQGNYVNANNLHQASVFNHSTTSGIQDAKPADQGRSCRDVFWAVLFYAHLTAIAYLAVVYAPQMVNDIAANTEGGGGRVLMTKSRLLDDGKQEDTDFDIDPSTLMVVLGACGILGLGVSTAALGFMMSFAEALIKTALLFNIVLFGAMGLLSLAGGALGVAIMCLIMCAFSAFYAWRVWSRIPFAASNLVTAVTAVRANLGLAFYAYLSLILLFMWSVFWAISVISTIYITSQCNPQGECQTEVNGGVVFLFLVSFYWTIQVISNVVHTTTAGTVGTWWMAPTEANGCCSRAVRDSYVRSITTSFGSICLGSLIVAIIQAVKEIIHGMRENGDSALACVAECLIGCIESLMEYFNKWAFGHDLVFLLVKFTHGVRSTLAIVVLVTPTVYVGLYGFSFMEAGSSVMNLFRMRGWTTIITDYMVDTVLFMVSLGVAVLTGILGILVAAAMQMSDGTNLGLSFIIGFMVGYAMCTTLFSIVSSGVNTVIVCYAEAPNEFQQNHPMLSERMRLSWRQAWPSEFNY